MRIVGVLVVTALLTGGCTSTGPAESVAPSTTTAPATTTTVAATTTQPAATTITSATTTTLGSTTVIGGALPDGTPYTVRIEPGVDRDVLSISGAIKIDLEDGSSRALGISVFRAGVTAEPGLDQLLRYTIPSGEGAVYISIYEEAVEHIHDLEGFLSSNIRAGTGSKLPTLQLSPPLRWATDEEVPLQMEVEYEGFVVRRGCGEMATICSPTGAAQVISADRVFGGTTGLTTDLIWIDSPGPRPTDQPSYVDPGPLSLRGGHDLLWTGREMIVWGGADGDRLPNLTDGAAFNPETSEWRTLAPIPLEDSKITRAVWAGRQMIVVSREATLGYEPDNDSWTVLGDGLYPPEVPGFLVWTGEGVGAWTSSGIHLLNLESGQWTELPHPGFGSSRPWEGMLGVLDGDLAAVGNGRGYCSGRRLATWHGSAWNQVPEVSLAANNYADCSWPNQTAIVGGQLIVWEDDIHLTKKYDFEGDNWTEVDVIPLSGSEGASGPVPIDNGFLVPQWGEAAIFDTTTESWSKVALPGQGWNHDMVWTGSEILSWGSVCCYGDGRDDFISMDAWRWTPPER